MTDQLGNDVVSYYEWAARRGTFPRFARNFFKAGNVSGLSGAINPVYGALVYDQVNRETNVHSILKKETWERSGFRVLNTNPAGKGYGGADPGTVGTVIDYAPTEVDSIPAFLHSPFDLTMDAGFRSQHDDGLDIWEWLVQINRDGHAQLLNETLLHSAEADAFAIGAGGSSDPKNHTGLATITNKGLESIDRFTSSEGEADVFAVGAGNYDVYEASGDVYGDRDDNVLADSVVVRPDGSTVGTGSSANLPFQIKGIDTLMDTTENNGADPSAQIFLTRRDTRRAFYDEIATAGRFDLTEVQAKLDYSGLSVSATHPGRDISYTIRAYQDRPIVVDKHVPSNGTTRTSFPMGGTGLGHWYAIDQRHLHIKVGFPTLYVDVDNPVIRGQFDTKALYLTCEQLYMTRFNTSGKVRSIAS